MAEVVAKSGVSKEKGYLYYLGKDGNVWRSQMARAGKGGGNAEKVADAGVTRESGYLYYIDKNGDVSRSPMARGRKQYILLLTFKKGSHNREPFFLCNIVLSLLNYMVDCTRKSEGKSASQRITYEKYNTIYDFFFVDRSGQS